MSPHQVTGLGRTKVAFLMALDAQVQARWWAESSFSLLLFLHLGTWRSGGQGDPPKTLPGQSRVCMAPGTGLSTALPSHPIKTKPDKKTSAFLTSGEL